MSSEPNGNAAFTVFNYGKGKIYFLTVPMENHLANTAGIFNNSTASSYWLIYKEIGKAQLNKHIIIKSQPMLTITEHLIQSDKCIAVIINMTPIPVTDRLSIKSG